MRDMKFFAILDDDQNEDIHVTGIHDDSGYRRVREALSAQYNLGNNEPNIQIYSADVRGDRSPTMHHYRHNRKPLDDGAKEVLKHVHRLWGFHVHLHSMQGDEIMQSFHCPDKSK